MSAGEAGGASTGRLRSAAMFGARNGSRRSREDLRHHGRHGHHGHHGGGSHWIAVAGGLGYVPVAPGTAGSLLGVLLFVGFAFGVGAIGVDAPVAPATFPSPLPLPSPATPDFAWASIGLLYSLGLLLLFWLGVWASGRAEIEFGRHDDGRIVIDEVVGQLITLSPLIFFVVEARPLAAGAASDFLPFFLWVVTGFVLFRLFDVLKPGAIGWVERRYQGGFGVMADDAVAGIHGAALLQASHWLLGPQALLPASHSLLGPQALLPASDLFFGWQVVGSWVESWVGGMG